MHLLQLTDSPRSESAQAFIYSLKASFPDLAIYVHGKPDTKAYFPLGTLPQKASLGASMVKRSEVLATLSQFSPSTTLIFADLASMQYLKSKDLDTYRCIQLLPVLQSSIEDTSIKKTLAKRSSQLEFIALSQRIADSWHSILGKEEIPIIYPAYLQPKQPPERESHQSFIVGVVSPLLPNMGIETVIQALHRNREIIPQLTVILVGDGPERKQLQWLVDHLDLRKRVQFVSTMDQYHRFLPNFDVVVMPDEQPQGFNPVYLHAFAEGIPIIATSIGINSELVEAGQTGLLFEPRNSHVLSQHLVNLYNHPDWMEYYRQKGPEVIRDKFDLTSFTKTMQEFLG